MDEDVTKGGEEGKLMSETNECDNGLPPVTELCERLQSLHEWWSYQLPHESQAVKQAEQQYQQRKIQWNMIQERLKEQPKTTRHLDDDKRSCETSDKESSLKNGTQTEDQKTTSTSILTPSTISTIIEYYNSQTTLSRQHREALQTEEPCSDSPFPVLFQYACDDSLTLLGSKESLGPSSESLVCELLVLRSFLKEKLKQSETDTTFPPSSQTVSLETMTVWIEAIESFLSPSITQDGGGRSSILPSQGDNTILWNIRGIVRNPSSYQDTSTKDPFQSSFSRLAELEAQHSKLLKNSEEELVRLEREVLRAKETEMENVRDQLQEQISRVLAVRKQTSSKDTLVKDDSYVVEIRRVMPIIRIPSV